MSLYLHRGSFETALEDEDQELNPNRWCSHSAWGQEAWQIVAQWTWNLRLELGHQLVPEPLRTTEFAHALPEQNEHPPHLQSHLLPLRPLRGTHHLPPRRPGKPIASREPTSLSNRMGRCAVQQGAPWSLMNNGESVMAVCWWSIPPAFATAVRGLLPRAVPMERERNSQTAPGQRPAPSSGGGIGSAATSRDWNRRHQRQACIHLHRHRLDIQMGPVFPPTPTVSPPILSRAQRAHYRLSWEERLARNALPNMAGQCTLTLFGIPESFAAWLGLTAV